MDCEIAVTIGKGIRRILYKNEWWFVLEDIVLSLTDSADAKTYIQCIKQRDPELSKGWGQIVHTLEFPTEGGKQKMDCLNTQGIFRIIQSIPAHKAELYKRWLAKVACERVLEIENPELGIQRTHAIFKAKGYSDEWIGKRMCGIAIREELTEEWKKRQVKEVKEHKILTAEIAKATFGVTPATHKKIKSLKRENLRDHMTDLELIFTMLGEASTTAITRADDAQGFVENKSAAKKGGSVAGKARKDLERKTGKKVVSRENYLTRPESRKKLDKSQ